MAGITDNLSECAFHSLGPKFSECDCILIHLAVAGLLFVLMQLSHRCCHGHHAVLDDMLAIRTPLCSIRASINSLDSPA